ncbi:MAG: PrsW family glutamic-type intramembrane protease, partial [Oscillospiraceae bacterium]|nr:PrsW family glutamic-type intramembrane protease [Oscillospiraceae bacterium]
MQSLVLIALLPAAALLFYVWKLDRKEHESPKLIWSLVGLGALSIIPAVILEMMLEVIIGIALPHNTIVYHLVEAFIGVAAIEEGGKYFMTWARTWKDREFNYSFDAVVYAVAASLGFAALENVMYVVQSGFATGIMRALTAVPGHTIFGIFMGMYYGLAKREEMFSNKSRKHRYLFLAWFVPMLIHGFYDFCLFMENMLFTLIFLVFYIALVIFAFFMVNRLSKMDAPVVAEPAIAGPGAPERLFEQGQQNPNMPPYPGYPQNPAYPQNPGYPQNPAYPQNP